MERKGACVMREEAEGVLKREGGRCCRDRRKDEIKAVMNMWWRGKER